MNNSQTRKKKINGFTKACPLCTKVLISKTEKDLDRQYNNHYFFLHSKVEKEDD